MRTCLLNAPSNIGLQPTPARRIMRPARLKPRRSAKKSAQKDKDPGSRGVILYLTSSVQMSLKSHCGPQPKAKPLKLGELCDFKRIFKERCRQGTGATASELRALYGVSSCFAVASAVSSKVSRGGRRLRVNGVGRRQPSLSPPRSTADGPPCFPL